jgi:sporulation protein YlmC with PRC-barrel domain
MEGDNRNAMTANDIKKKESHMFKHPKFIAVPAVALALLWNIPSVQADDEVHTRAAKGQCTASEMIGKKVKNLQDEDLGKIHDLVINGESGTVPYAIISHGGLFGAGRSKTAVPLDSLKPAPDGKSVVLEATKEQLQTATRTTTGEWANAAHAEWARSVDGFYGTPRTADRARLDRDRLQPSDRVQSTDVNDRDRDGRDRDRNPGDRTYVRDPVPKGAEVMMTPADAALGEKISESTDFVHVRVNNGITHIYGQVDNEDQRKAVESKIRAVPGVNRVESHLKIKNP